MRAKVEAEFKDMGDAKLNLLEKIPPVWPSEIDENAKLLTERGIAPWLTEPIESIAKEVQSASLSVDEANKKKQEKKKARKIRKKKLKEQEEAELNMITTGIVT